LFTSISLKPTGKKKDQRTGKKDVSDAKDPMTRNKCRKKDMPRRRAWAQHIY